jgi:AraC family transcriptional regulator
MSEPINRKGDSSRSNKTDGTNPSTPEHRVPHVEMARVMNTAPLRINLESSGSIALWRHDPVHEVVKAMADHVVMIYPSTVQRLERRSGKTSATGTGRPGVVTIIPAGVTSRWDVTPVGIAGRPDAQQLPNLIQLYLPHATLQRVADEADTFVSPSNLVERIGHPDKMTYELLKSAADALEDNSALDGLFRQQLTELLSTRLLMAHSGSESVTRPVVGGLSPAILRRAIERLRSESDADVSLAALASDAGLSRFHFCRAFKESTGLSPHAWLRQRRLEQAMNLLRDSDAAVVSIAVELGYSSQTAFAAAFKKLTGVSPTDWRRRS